MTDRPVIPFVSNIDQEPCEAWLEHLQAALPDFRIAHFDGQRDISEATVALVANPDPQCLAQMPKLKWVQSLRAGVEKLVQVLPNDVAIVRMTDPQLAKTMAEAVLTMTLYLHRDLPKYAVQQTNRVWEQHPVVVPQDRKVGILGLGALGGAACEALTKNGFDVLGWSRSQKTVPGVECFCGERGLDQLLRVADIVVVLLPLTDGTRGLLDKTRLGQMKRGASIINFARAQIIETDGLLELLRNGHLYHAVLDVFETEPLAQSDCIWSGSNLTILPHVSAPTNMKTASEIAANNIKSYFETGCLPRCVDRRKGY